MRFFCTSLKSCNADHCGYLSGRPGSVRRFPHRMSSEAQKVACFLAPLKQNPSPAALLCEADVLVFIDLDDPAAACVEDLPEDVVHVRALGRVMRFGLLEASVRGGLPTVRRSISRPSSCRPPPIRVGANARRARRRDGRTRRTPARMQRSDRTPRRRGRIVHSTLPKVPSVPFSSLLRSGEANRTFCGPSPPVRRKGPPRRSRPSGTRRRCASRPLIRIA